MKKGALVSLLVFVLVTFSVFSSQAKTTVKVDTDNKYQTIEGWGASLCWWAHMVGQWDDEAAIDDIVDKITSPDQLNMNIFRYNIGGGDHPSHYSTPEKPGHMAHGKGVRAELEGFKASEDAPYDWNADAGQRKIMLKIKAKRPDVVFEAFSNSPPYWMTFSGCSAGNSPASADNLKPEYYEAFCDYLLNVCAFYKKEHGIEFKTLEPFNESLTSYWGENGSQEGCHFDIESQIKIIKTLYPKLQKTGLNTVISASDETNLGLFINELKAYQKEDGVMDMIGQLNTHTYGGSDKERQQVKALTASFEGDFWQSETGPSGFRSSGFRNNLQLAQRMFADLKLMHPVAWLDWQLFEEGNDTWCQIRGDFEKETYHVVKNFYVRMQVTRFIKQGYTLIEADHEDVLAAISPEGDEIVLVCVNYSELASPVAFQLDAAMQNVQLFRTTREEDCKAISFTTPKGKSLSYDAPAYSISTFVVKL